MQPIMYERRSRRKLAAGLIAIIVIAGIVMAADHEKSEDRQGIVSAATSTNAQSVASPVSMSTTSVSGATTSSYKDGTYSATSDYYVPHGTEEIQVSVTLQNGVITSSNVTNSENNGDSAQFQESFAAAYKTYVVGKSINSLSLNTISGASDTTQGFNDALHKIASQAQA